MRPAVSEADVAAIAVAELQRYGYETFEEVEVGEGRADIVGRRGAEVLVAEVKVSPSLVVLGQAARWRGLAHRVLVVVHRATRGPGAAVFQDFCRWRGIGLWEVSPTSRGDHLGHNVVRAAATSGVAEVIAPEFWRLAGKDRRGRRRAVDSAHILKWLNDGNRSGSQYAAAGSSSGGYWTPFKQTAGALALFVAENPGTSLKGAVDGIRHHYRTSRSALGALPGLIRNGAVPGVRLELGEQGRLTLWPDGTTAAAKRERV